MIKYLKKLKKNNSLTLKKTLKKINGLILTAFKHHIFQKAYSSGPSIYCLMIFLDKRNIMLHHAKNLEFPCWGMLGSESLWFVLSVCGWTELILNIETGRRTVSNHWAPRIMYHSNNGKKSGKGQLEKVSWIRI